jgi:hypothetical protein
MWKSKDPRVAKAILKKNKFGKLTVLAFKTSDRVIIKPVWCWQKDRLSDQQTWS